MEIPLFVTYTWLSLFDVIRLVVVGTFKTPNLFFVLSSEEKAQYGFYKAGNISFVTIRSLVDKKLLDVHSLNRLLSKESALLWHTLQYSTLKFTLISGKWALTFYVYVTPHF